MKENTHPEYHTVTVTCTTCGNTFETGSTLSEIRVDTCSKCHPYYTGEQRFAKAEGRVGRFMKKYNMEQK